VRLLDELRIPLEMKHQKVANAVKERLFGSNAIMFETQAFTDSLKERLVLIGVEAGRVIRRFVPTNDKPIPATGKWNLL